MPDIRSIVKNHALNRDQEAAGAAAAWGTLSCTPPQVVSAGALEKQDPLCGVRASLGTLRGVKSLPGPWETRPQEGSQGWKGTQDPLSLMHKRNRMWTHSLSHPQYQGHTDTPRDTKVQPRHTPSNCCPDRPMPPPSSLLSKLALLS